MYGLLNERKFDKCFKIIDPRVREAGTIKFEAYRTCLSHFVDKYGPLQELRIGHLKLYCKVAERKGDRDFAYALVFVHDKRGQQLELKERWVRDDDGLWYTLKTGLV
jgi:hypothetical protein